MRIYTFLEWSECNIRGKVVCHFDHRHCQPLATVNECVECYEDYVNTAVPKYCKRGEDE